MDIWEICISSYHIIHVIIYASLISYFMLIHIGSSEGETLLEFKEEAEDNQGTPQPTSPEGEELAIDEFLECLDH